MNLLKNNDAAGVCTFPMYSVWQFPLRQKKRIGKKKNHSIIIEKLVMHLYHNIIWAKYQRKLTGSCNKPAVLKQRHYTTDYLLLVKLESRDSLQFFNCMAHLSTISVILLLFSSKFSKSCKAFVIYVQGGWATALVREKRIKKCVLFKQWTGSHWSQEAEAKRTL